MPTQVALHFMHYNSAKIHKTLRVTPAMEARVSDQFGTWSYLGFSKMMLPIRTRAKKVKAPMPLGALFLQKVTA